MKTKRMALTVCMALVFGSGARGEDQFTPGNIFVSGVIGEGCNFGGDDIIVEIHPITGPFNRVASREGGLCTVSGLRFTPEGDRLLALNAGHSGFILSIAPDESNSVLLDASDGLNRPFGANGLAFDAAGDLYVLNTGDSTILRFPAGGGPGTVFADFNDGILGRGALDFAPNGDLFYCGDLAGAVIRITPEGESSVFDDTVLFPSSLVFDLHGNLFVVGASLEGRTIYRYEGRDPNARSVVANGFLGVAGVPSPLAVSPDGSELYLFEISGIIYGIDAEDGTRRIIGDLTDFHLFATPTGITVYTPPEATGSCCEDGSGVCTNDLTHTECEGSGRRYGGDGTDCGTIDPPCSPPPECGDDLVNQPSEECDGTDDAACQGQCQANCTCPPVPPVTGRCCLSAGRCETTTRAQCDSQAGGFGGVGTSCEGDGDEIDVACEGVPATSAWGIIILVLALLTGIAIKFGFQCRPSCG
ncbi:MAG: hypothetical protein IID42_01470 [Planctomycetes bacterium]|nr:hypothetical protein [Planctomycetota bacterium]